VNGLQDAPVNGGKLDAVTSGRNAGLIRAKVDVVPAVTKFMLYGKLLELDVSLRHQVENDVDGGLVAVGRA